jgi:hypothetical protein
MIVAIQIRNVKTPVISGVPFEVAGSTQTDDVFPENALIVLQQAASDAGPWTAAGRLGSGLPLECDALGYGANNSFIFHPVANSACYARAAVVVDEELVDFPSNVVYLNVKKPTPHED